MDEERISQRILYVIVALSVIVFLAFYLIGYDMPFADNTAFNAPMLTDVLLGFMWGLLALTTLASVFAVVRGIQRANRSEGVTNGILHERFLYDIRCDRSHPRLDFYLWFNASDDSQWTELHRRLLA